MVTTKKAAFFKNKKKNKKSSGGALPRQEQDKNNRYNSILHDTASINPLFFFCVCVVWVQQMMKLYVCLCVSLSSAFPQTPDNQKNEIHGAEEEDYWAIGDCDAVSRPRYGKVERAGEIPRLQGKLPDSTMYGVWIMNEEELDEVYPPPEENIEQT